ncbi:hypothetical protein H7097_00555 [Aeromicrobium sp.]|nr:hypothetical protein [Candidatus Saccharibacteria bacterium]
MSNTIRNSINNEREDWTKSTRTLSGDMKNWSKDVKFWARSSRRELGRTALIGVGSAAIIGGLAIAGLEVKATHDHEQEVSELIHDALQNPADAKGLNAYTAVEGDTATTIVEKLARPADEHGNNGGAAEIKLDIAVQTGDNGVIQTGQVLLLERMALDPTALAAHNVSVYSMPTK